ncbi:DgyrCDS14175 [Dimorphilus gyrociliatus]|uniref:protein-tyrosine-phosphatase n=1 Tax=Dimorphilus gyrociliatus TaxID=2664684 RepID=A0A7I8WCZ9_9ANNE|nr:DgyrCDS14175 [Dimorphilus gyrociliatus]
MDKSIFLKSMLIVVVMCLLNCNWCHGMKISRVLQKFETVRDKSGRKFDFSEDCYSISTKRNKRNVILQDYITSIKVSDYMESKDMTPRYLLEKLASFYKVPSEHVHLKMCGQKALFYVVKKEAKANSVDVKDWIAPYLVSAKLNAAIAAVPSEIGLTAQSQKQSNEEDKSVMEYVPYVVVAVICLVLLAVILSVWAFTRRKKSEKCQEQRLVCVYPSVKPNLISTSQVQPDSPSPSPFSTPKIKNRSLLERRGSNASLTISLTPPPPQKSAIKECSAQLSLESNTRCLSFNELSSTLENVESLTKEFWEIPMNHPDKAIVSGSGTLNRYRTIIPNETTRIKLNEQDGKPGYINANYIRGYNGQKRAFIATQGPMPHTIVDFWKMIWQEKCEIIIMITKLEEEARNKCEMYIPETGDVRHGDFEISVENISYHSSYEIRAICFRYNDESRTVKHFWYTAWPDQKTPETARDLVQLIEDVKSVKRDQPVVVHCSAGIGRTGCFIATFIGILQILMEKKLFQ